QANDLVGRKLGRDGGLAARATVAEMRSLTAQLAAPPNLSGLAKAYSTAVDALERAIAYVAENYATNLASVSVGAVPLLKLFGIVAGGWQLLRSALISQQRLPAAPAEGADDGFLQGKIS